MNRLFTIILLLAVSISAWATTYERHTMRMNDHFIHAEWEEVLIETEQMVKLKPSDADPYSAALIAAQFLDDVSTENRYLRLSQQNRIHIDTVMVHVYNRTRTIKNAQIYEQLLLNLKANHKWMSKVFNIYLLDFYNFARKTHETIAIANELLQLTPDNTRILRIKANALFYQGNIDDAVVVHERLLSLEPNSYESLTFLGVYYTAICDKEIADIEKKYLNELAPDDKVYMAAKQAVIDEKISYTLTLLQKANDITPSDFLAAEIERLSNTTSKLPQHPTTKREQVLKMIK